MQQGWIRVHRSLMEHWLHEDKPFGKFGAWVDLLLMANHEARKMPIGGELSTIERGQLFTSSLTLSARWGWSRGKVERFLKQLENDQMMERKRTPNGQLLTLVNYSVYQDLNTTNGHQTDNRRTSNGQPTDTNKELKNVKNEKNESNNKFSNQIAQVFEYLNQKTGKRYTGRSEAQRKFIIARLKEGYTVEEFKRVIDNKVAAWKHDEKMNQYLRPETLFGTKFETYLNDTETEAQRARREDHELHEQQVAAIRAAAGIDYVE